MGKVFYIAYCIIVYLEYFPRLIKLIKTKSSNDYSLGSIILSLVGMVTRFKSIEYTINQQ
mgnify:CR=1 FL=1